MIPITKPLNFLNQISIYDDELKRNLKFIEKDEVSHQQLRITKFHWDPQNFQNKLKNYRSEIKGVNNLTKMHPYPILTSLPYFEHCKKKLLQF